MINRIKTQNRPDTPKMTNGPVQHITVEESTSIQWVQLCVELFDLALFFYHTQTDKTQLSAEFLLQRVTTAEV